MTPEQVREDTNTPDIVAGTENDMHTPVDTTIVDETAVSKLPPDKAPAVPLLPRDAAAVTNPGSSVALLTPEDSQRFRTVWNEVQGKFVDEPRAAVQQADALVSEVIEHLTRMFASEHTLLEGQWKQGKEVSTEDLRQALLRYHSFFKRLVV